MLGIMYACHAFDAASLIVWPFVILCVYLCFAYKSQVTFDLTTRTVTSISGLRPFLKKRTWSFDQIRSFYCKKYPSATYGGGTSGGLRYHAGYFLTMSVEPEQEVEIVVRRATSTPVEAEGNKLATALQKPFVDLGSVESSW